MPDLAQQLGARNMTERPPVAPGEPAPDVQLPLIKEDRMVSIAEYRGRAALFLAIERGLFCPFCRRHMAHLGLSRAKLSALGIEVLVVVGTKLDRARAYLGPRPAPVPLAADPMHRTHRAYGLPRYPATPEVQAAVVSARIDPFRDLAEPRPLGELSQELERDDPYEWTPADQEAFDAGQQVLMGQFLIDRDGIVRWANVEGSGDGLAGLARFPSEKEILAAARALA
jgi:peroxiredoxin